MVTTELTVYGVLGPGVLLLNVWHLSAKQSEYSYVSADDDDGSYTSFYYDVDDEEESEEEDEDEESFRRDRRKKKGNSVKIVCLTNSNLIKACNIFWRKEMWEPFCLMLIWKGTIRNYFATDTKVFHETNRILNYLDFEF